MACRRFTPNTSSMTRAVHNGCVQVSQSRHDPVQVMHPLRFGWHSYRLVPFSMLLHNCVRTNKTGLSVWFREWALY